MPANDVTDLLNLMRNGDRGAIDALLPVVYEELREIARRQLRGERSDHTLQTTALVHEAYLKLVDQRQADWKNRAHFFAIASQAMRRILLDYARARLAQKRGGENQLVTFDEEITPVGGRPAELIALDESLTRLGALNERQGRIVELRFFGGLKNEEIAEVLGISEPTVRRDWRLARAFLARELRSA